MNGSEETKGGQQITQHAPQPLPHWQTPTSLGSREDKAQSLAPLGNCRELLGCRTGPCEEVPEGSENPPTAPLTKPAPGGSSQCFPRIQSLNSHGSSTS